MQPAPSRKQNRALARLLHRLQNEFCGRFWLSDAHTPETDIYRRWPRLQKFRQGGGRRPVRFDIQKPIANDMSHVIPIQWFRHDGGTETVKYRLPPKRGGMMRPAQRRRGQIEDFGAEPACRRRVTPAT